MGILMHHIPFDIANSYSTEIKTTNNYAENKN